VTTPIYYVNDVPHIGSAYTTIAADILARYHKLKGDKVFFLTGTDEHGKKIQQIAESKGKKPEEFVDEIVKSFKELWARLNISNDYFIRTTDPQHVEEVKKILQELYDKKFIYKGHYEAYYCVGCEQYLTETDLVEGCCPLHKKEPEVRKEESYLFKLSEFQERLLNLIRNDTIQILPASRKNEMVNFIKDGLKDISISRKKSEVYWGVELPFDTDHT
jgi:methionyl-tRNA synthetase